jgi:hypothetical protein
VTENPPAEVSPAEEPEETGPNRRCLATGERLPKERLIRFVVGPDGAIVPDLAGRLPGRGLWLSARHDIVALAVKKHLFSRAARRPVGAGPDLADRVADLLAARCGETIGLARRAGQAVAGFEKVRDALQAGPAGVVLAAADAGTDGVRRIRALAGAAPVISVLTGAELGSAFGRDRAVHALLRPGALAVRLRIDAGRLAGFRGFVPDTPAADGV